MSFQLLTPRAEAGLFSHLQDQPGEHPDPLLPLLAGAHARGVADALELAGVPALLIDAQGMVLHVGAAASALFGPALRVDYVHLVGMDAQATRAIQNLILEALAEGPLPAPLQNKTGGQGMLILRAQRLSGAVGNFNQLLKVLILIEKPCESEMPTGVLGGAFEGCRDIAET